MGKRIGVSAHRRLRNKTAFRHGYIDQEVSGNSNPGCYGVA
jgi:hypothetical protein